MARAAPLEQMMLFDAPTPNEQSRVVSWFSCGAASAVATRLAIEKYGDRVVVVYTDPKGEHPDNKRFLADCERWFGRNIIVMTNNRYHDPWDVMRVERYIVGPDGAHCTGVMKRELRYTFQRPDDIQVFGYTSEEAKRVDRFRAENFEVYLETPLIDAGLNKADCKAMLRDAGIAIPAMYLLGFQNNNCIGCPKGGMGYWNMIRKHFPEAFDRMAKLERDVGASCCRSKGERVYLDELDPARGNILSEPDIECSLMCHGEAA
ncbi:hypothetical protein WG907_04510 [Sphingobium sp. AN558]|uniref:hypothetical protein n=1 Tax=Sphingobium sp. AN558 TaxID=3133442 RepID=UPI0030C55667